MHSCSKGLWRLKLILGSVWWKSIGLILEVVWGFPQDTHPWILQERGSLLCVVPSKSMSWMFTANNLQPFLTHFFACKEDICLTQTFFGMPWNFTWLPRISVHKIDLCKQSSMTWCCSNQSMPISTSYDPKGRMFRFTFVRKPFRFTSHFLTIYETFCFVPMANWTNQCFSCFILLSLHSPTILGET